MIPAVIEKPPQRCLLSFNTQVITGILTGEQPLLGQSQEIIDRLQSSFTPCLTDK